jgi:alanyl-tRNA synthetase
MLTKQDLKKEFSGDWKKHYMVEIFKQKGFIRKKCSSCGDFFWTLNPERKTCGDSSCEPYGFIGNTITKGSWNYIEMWRMFEKFFVKNGHKSIKRYPVIDRVRPDLFFTIASIQDFQRIENGNMIFVYPANPLIVPQMCLRFNDIDSVGVSGRHLTCFMMPGQHAFGYPKQGYFKDECMRLDFEFLTKTMGIPENEITYKEDIWAMPDFSAFGPCIESFSRGLELVNHVFMQFQKSGKSYKKLDVLVNDTGWGHERLVWFSNGTNTMYDCIFGNVIDGLKKTLGIKPSELFLKYAKLAGRLDIGEIKNTDKVREKIAKELETDVKTLKHEIEPMQAIYAIADHTRTLLFAITDGGIPSNVGGGYNLRVILRRVFSFMKEYNMDFDIMRIMEEHAKYLFPLFPELKSGLNRIQEIIDIEKRRYENSLEESKRIITKLLRRGEKFDNKTLVKLYESNGITPDMVKEITGIEIPDEIYSQITKKHISKHVVKKTMEMKNVRPTKKLFYERPDDREFDAKVVWAKENKVVLDRTLFYPESGGQDSDKGTINGFMVRNVQKIGDVILHEVDHRLKKGQKVHGIIDWERRKQLNQHHTAVHIINGASRSILGDHIWQAGANKTIEKATLDITHYKPLTTEELHRIEDKANEIIERGIKINKMFLSRKEAEERYSLRIYQGGVIPEKQIRIIEIPGVDVEACSGIHCNNTKEVDKIVLLNSERIQDGINRITLKAGKAAKEYLEEILKTSRYILSLLDEMPFIKITEELKRKMKNPQIALRELRLASKVFDVSLDQMEPTVKKFAEQVLEDKNRLNILETKAGIERTEFDVLEERESLKDICEFIFELWKTQRKKIEKVISKAAVMEARKLMAKVKNNRIFEIISGTKEELIKTASSLLDLNSNLTVILANQSGDIIGMSRTENVSEIITDICKRAGGAGGGKENFAQGKAELSKLMRILPSYK